jgi:hypothetical protein
VRGWRHFHIFGVSELANALVKTTQLPTWPTSALPGRTTTLPPGLARYVSDAILTNADRVTL